MRRVLLPLFLFAASSSLIAEDAPKTQPIQIVEKALAGYGGLYGAGKGPWHLKADIQLFDESGTPTEKGTFDEYYGDPSHRRVEFALPSYTRTTIINGADSFHEVEEKGAEMPLAIAFGAISRLMNPGPSALDIHESAPTLHKVTLDGQDLQCVMLNREVFHTKSNAPLGLFPTYCVSPDGLHFRVLTYFGDVMLVFNRNAVVFNGNELARTVVVYEGKLKVAQVDVTSVAKAPEMPLSLFTPGPKAVQDKLVTENASAEAMAAKLVTSVPPVYPPSAQDAHVKGPVALQAAVNREGKVTSLKLLSAPRADLAQAAMVAARHWRYSPTLRDGKAIPYTGIIVVEFR